MDLANEYAHHWKTIHLLEQPEHEEWLKPRRTFPWSLVTHRSCCHVLLLGWSLKAWSVVFHLFTFNTKLCWLSKFYVEVLKWGIEMESALDIQPRPDSLSSRLMTICSRKGQTDNKMCGKYAEDKRWLWSTCRPTQELTASHQSHPCVIHPDLQWSVYRSVSGADCWVPEKSPVLVYCWVGGSVEQWTECKFRHWTGLGLYLSSVIQLWENPRLTVFLLCSLWHAAQKDFISATLDPGSEVWISTSSLNLWALKSEFFLCLSHLNMCSKKAVWALSVLWNWSHVAIFQGLIRRVGL